MAKFKKSDFRPARERIDALPKARRDKIEAGTAKILEAMHLSEIRKALSVTQAKLAETSGLLQGEISRIERNPESAQLRTLERYAKGMGGEVSVIIAFPDGLRAELPVTHGRPVKSRVSVQHDECEDGCAAAQPAI